MNKRTMLYGLLIAGGVLAYFAWKKNKAGSQGYQEASASTSGNFADDTPVSQEVANELLQGTAGEKPVRSIKESLSQIVEPFIDVKQQTELSGQGQFLES